MENLIIRKAFNIDLFEISKNIEKFNLDGENIKANQFIVAQYNDNLAGFGRIKPYKNFYELSSIGVIEEYRNKGVGKEIINHLIKIFPSDEIWITTKIPDYFKKLGFIETNNPPIELLKKCERVCQNHSTSLSFYMLYKK